MTTRRKHVICLRSVGLDVIQCFMFASKIPNTLYARISIRCGCSYIFMRLLFMRVNFNGVKCIKIIMINESALEKHNDKILNLNKQRLCTICLLYVNCIFFSGCYCDVLVHK